MAARFHRQVSWYWISTAHNGFRAIRTSAPRRVHDWHAECIWKARKEKANENQDEFEGWAFGRRTDRELMIVSERKKGRKEEGDENQNEFEGWHNLYLRQLAGGVYAAKARRVNLARRLAINRERSKTMKTKTNLKAGYEWIKASFD